MARSTFQSPKAVSSHFDAGVFPSQKSKVLKTGSLGPLLEVEMSKKCTPLWRQAHFQAKSVKLKTDGLGALFELGERKDLRCHMGPCVRQISR